MRIVYKPLLPVGFEQEIIKDNADIPEGFTDIEPPVPNWKPVFDWDTNKWIELATDEEKQGSAVDDVSDLDQLKQQNAMMAKQLATSGLQQNQLQQMMAKMMKQIAELENGGNVDV